MDEYTRQRRLADRERGLRRVRTLTAAAGAGMVAVATVFAMTFAGSAAADSAPAATGVPADPGGVDAGNVVPDAGTGPPAPVTRSAAPRTTTASAGAGLTPPSTTPTRTRTATRHHSSSSSSTHARTAGS